ncbi:MAG: alpha/beta hydrolase [Acidimicrobiia bacterium]|nr:alpha/beta hydrolase [Acidimicrobiia bacterium]
MSAVAFDYTPIPERLVADLDMDARPEFGERVSRRLAAFANVGPPRSNSDGERETIGGTEVIHRFVEAPGDSETLRWHLVEAGAGEPVVFLHGLPDSWFMWHRQLDAFASTHHVIAVDLKGYGQSDKRTGDYRAPGVAEQLLALLDVLGLEEFNVVAHDRGAVLADHLGAMAPSRVLRYVRSEQHLWHFHPDLAPQQLLFTDPARTSVLAEPAVLVVAAYLLLCAKPVADADLARTIQEWSHPQINWAVPRYFNSSSFRQEWIDRRTRLIERWDFPVLVLQGARDPRQPREFYEGVDCHLPDGRVAFVDAGHFCVLENPAETTAAIASFIT